MTILSGFVLPQTCDVYRKTTTTNSDLNSTVRTYPSTATYSAVACLVGPFMRGGDRGVSRYQYGDNYVDRNSLITGDDADIQEQDQIVLKKWRNGAALSASEQTRNTYIVERVIDGSYITGHKQYLIIPERKR